MSLSLVARSRVVNTGRIFLAVSLIVIGFQDFFFGAVCARGRAGAAGLDSGACRLPTLAPRRIGRSAESTQLCQRTPRGMFANFWCTANRDARGPGGSCASARPPGSLLCEPKRDHPR